MNNRIAQYLDGTKIKHGEDWEPTTPEDKEYIAKGCAEIMQDVLRNCGFEPAGELAKQRLLIMCAILVEFSLAHQGTKDGRTNFFTVLGIAMSAIVTATVNEFVVIGKLRK